METEKLAVSISEDQFVNLLDLVQHHQDQSAMLELLDYYEEDMKHLSKYLRMPYEDAMQTLRIELLELVTAGLAE
ncbi:hypothetical protein PQ456_21260 [Paenibacillus kyungheensis]|uniref:Helix-turn-helix conjugative transposon-like domain-containing protein n=1 Tax=Paenibacillus kyungheensis TaxID=1452732 RepID=A0AAX3M111_9BACL|nr:hypothetical protein [Paenibacillus kyungheensis]WCT55643.1 hypothetical protein PQ456_21260 [Paenibacillus kyungheensis]